MIAPRFRIYVIAFSSIIATSFTFSFSVSFSQPVVAQILVEAEGVPHTWLVRPDTTNGRIVRYASPTKEYVAAVFPGVPIKTASKALLESVPTGGNMEDLPNFPAHDPLVNRIRIIRKGNHPYRILTATGMEGLWVVIPTPSGPKRCACKSPIYTNSVFPGVRTENIPPKELEAIPAETGPIDEQPGFPSYIEIVGRTAAREALEAVKKKTK